MRAQREGKRIESPKSAPMRIGKVDNLGKTPMKPVAKVAKAGSRKK